MHLVGFCLVSFKTATKKGVSLKNPSAPTNSFLPENMIFWTMVNTWELGSGVASELRISFASIRRRLGFASEG